METGEVVLRDWRWQNKKQNSTFFSKAPLELHDVCGRTRPSCHLIHLMTDNRCMVLDITVCVQMGVRKHGSMDGG